MKKWKKNINSFILRVLRHPITKDTLSVTTLSVIGKGLGLLVPFFIAAWFGVNLKTDIFFLCYAIVLYLTGIFSYALESNIVPFIAELRKEEKGEIAVFINKVFSLNFLVMLGLALVFLSLARPLFTLLTDFPENSTDLLFKFLVLISPLLILVVCSSILAGILNAYFKFWLPAISPGIRAIVCLAMTFALKPRFGIHAVILGYVFGELARLIIFSLVLAKQKIVSLRFNIHIDNRLLSFFKTAAFQMGAMAVTGLNPLVDKTMASWLEVGSISVLQYADRIYFIPFTVIASGLIVVILSHWSLRYYQHKKPELLKQDMHKTLGIVAIITVILTVLFSVFSRPIVHIAYARGEFPLRLLSLVRQTFLFYLVGLSFSSTSQVLIRAHLVLKNTKALMKISFVSVTLNILLNLILMSFFAVKGIALSSTIVSAVTFIYSYRLFNSRCGRT